MIPTRAFLDAAALAALTAQDVPVLATHFEIVAPDDVTFGVDFLFTVTALTASDTTATLYAGTFELSTTDSSGDVPAGPQSLVDGTGLFSTTGGGFVDAGFQTITATDDDDPSITGTSNNIFVA